MGLRKRYCLLDVERLLEWTGHNSLAELRQHYQTDIHERIQKQILSRETQWTDAVAVGSESFIESVTQGVTDRCRWYIEELVVGRSQGNVLREPTPAYMRFSGAKNDSKD